MIPILKISVHFITKNSYHINTNFQGMQILVDDQNVPVLLILKDNLSQCMLHMYHGDFTKTNALQPV